MPRSHSIASLAGLALLTGSSGVLASESPWIDLVVARQLATACPTDFTRIHGTRRPEDLDPAIAILRQREAAIARDNTIPEDRPKVDAAMEAYATTLAGLIDKNVKAEGCTATFSGFGLDPITAPDLSAYARTVAIPESQRPKDLPKILDTGTNAALSLQRRIMLDLAADPRRCRPDGVSVEPLSIERVLAGNLPPFVGAPLYHQEAWTLSCAQGRETFTIGFIQDARRWRSYSIKERP